MHKFKWITAALIITALAVPSSVLARGGGAAGDQYTEQVPNASGNGGSSSSGSPSSGGGPTGGTSSSSTGDSSSGTGGAGSLSGGSGPINSATAGKFGKDGAAAAGLANRTAPDSQALRDAASQAQLGESGANATVFDAPGSATSSDGGMGVALPIILGVILLGGIAYAVSRRRGDSGRPGPRPTSGFRNRLRRPDLPERG